MFLDITKNKSFQICIGRWLGYIQSIHPNKKKTTSTHSWLGLTTLILASIQLLLGYYAFFYPNNQLSPVQKESFVGKHAFFGTLVILMATLTISTGISENLIFNQACNADVSNQCALGNTLALLVICTTVCLLYFLSAYKKASYGKHQDQTGGETQALLSSTLSGTTVAPPPPTV